MERFEEITVCAECGEDLTSVSWDSGNGWDGVSMCSGCREIEGDTDTVFECSKCGERYSTEDCDCWEVCMYCNGTGLDAGEEMCKACKATGLIEK